MLGLIQFNRESTYSRLLHNITKNIHETHYNHTSACPTQSTKLHTRNTFYNQFHQIAACYELHHDIHEAGSIARFVTLEYEGSVLFIYCLIISLLNCCRRNLQGYLFLRRKRLLQILFHYSQRIWSKDCMHVTYLLCIDKLPNFSTKALLYSNVSDLESFKRDQSSSMEFCNGDPVRSRYNYLGTKFNSSKSNIWIPWGGVALSTTRAFHLQHELAISTV